jgi:hypothetical protein
LHIHYKNRLTCGSDILQTWPNGWGMRHALPVDANCSMNAAKGTPRWRVPFPHTALRHQHRMRTLVLSFAAKHAWQNAHELQPSMSTRMAALSLLLCLQLEKGMVGLGHVPQTAVRHTGAGGGVLSCAPAAAATARKQACPLLLLTSTELHPLDKSHVSQSRAMPDVRGTRQDGRSAARLDLGVVAQQ